MSKDHPFFADLSRMASGAAGLATDMRQEIESLIAAQTDKILARTHLVTREEFEIVKAMAEKARAENEALTKRLEALEQSK